MADNETLSNQLPAHTSVTKTSARPAAIYTGRQHVLNMDGFQGFHKQRPNYLLKIKELEKKFPEEADRVLKITEKSELWCEIMCMRTRNQRDILESLLYKEEIKPYEAALLRYQGVLFAHSFKSRSSLRRIRAKTKNLPVTDPIMRSPKDTRLFE
jgi:hypothetical protein